MQRLTVMHEGRIIADGGYEECLAHPEVRRSYWQIDVELDGRRACRLMTTADAILTVKGLNVSYGEAKVLFDMDLSVRPRQIVACVGRNGAGKTTLLKSIAGFLKPLAGSITSDHASLVGRKSYDIAKMGIKYVPQDKKVFSDLTVRENLELGSYATKDYNWDRVTAYFPKLKVLMDRKAGYLSGGERQMLMIGRALLGSPKVLLIDEPTGGTGAEHRLSPEKGIRRIAQERGAGDRGAEPAVGLRDIRQGIRHQRGPHRGRARGPRTRSGPDVCERYL